MDTNNNDIFSKIGRKSGETVPENYFSDFRARMMASLPEKPAEAPDVKRSFWSAIRPYAYMAAMFAGVWLMMNMFDLVRSGRTDSIENSPELLAALNNDSFVSDYVMPDVETYQVYDDLYDEDFDPAVLASFNEAE